MDQKHIEILMDRADLRRKEDLERSMAEDAPTENSCDECGEGPAYLYGDGCYCSEHRPRAGR